MCVPKSAAADWEREFWKGESLSQVLSFFNFLPYLLFVYCSTILNDNDYNRKKSDTRNTAGKSERFDEDNFYEEYEARAEDERNSRSGECEQR